MEQQPHSIYKAIPKIMSEMDAIGKDKTNKDQGYKYRSIDSLYNSLQKLMSKHGVFTVPRALSRLDSTRTTKSGTNMYHSQILFEFTFYADDGSSVQCEMWGEGQDTSDKASGKCASYAHKYALLQVFCIPTDDLDDTDGESIPTTPQRPQQPQKTPETPKNVMDFNTPVTEQQLLQLMTLIKDTKHTPDEVNEAVKTLTDGKKSSAREISSGEYQLLLAYLKKNKK